MRPSRLEAGWKPVSDGLLAPLVGADDQKDMTMNHFRAATSFLANSHRATTFFLAVLVVAGACSREADKPAKAKAFPDSIADDEYLVWVNSSPIRGRDLRVFTLLYQAGTPDSLRDRTFNLRMLDGLIDRTLLRVEAEAVGIQIQDSVTQWYFNQFATAMGGEATLDNILKSENMSRSDLERLIREDLFVRAFVETKVSGPAEVSDSVARAYFENNPRDFWTQDSVRARHIILRASQNDTPADIEKKRQTLRDLRARAQKGESFAELARQYSEDPAASRGGDLGYFSYRDMVTAFSDAAFALKPGQLSDVVETQFGYHLIKLEDKKPARKLEYEAIETALKNQIAQYMAAQALQNHLQRSRAVAIIEKNY